MLLWCVSFTPITPLVAASPKGGADDIIVTGQGSPIDPSDKGKHLYSVRDGLTPKVILQLAQKAEQNKKINTSWLGDLDCIYGHYTSSSGVEALVFSRDGDKSQAEGLTHVWLFGLQGSKWTLLKNVGVWDIVKAQVVDVNGDGLEEVMIDGSGGNGLGYYEGVLYSLKGNRLEKLYHNEGHGNWVQGYHPDYENNILERFYVVSFTRPDSAGMRTLIEQQDLLMGSRIDSGSLDQFAGPGDRFEEKGLQQITTRFNLEKGSYRPIPQSAVTTEEPIEMDTIPDASVRISVPLGGE